MEVKRTCGEDSVYVLIVSAEGRATKDASVIRSNEFSDPLVSRLPYLKGTPQVVGKDEHEEMSVKAEWEPGPAEGCSCDPRWC